MARRWLAGVWIQPALWMRLWKRSRDPVDQPAVWISLR
jgi:hypothetical protein